MDPVSVTGLVDAGNGVLVHLDTGDILLSWPAANKLHADLEKVLSAAGITMKGSGRSGPV